ncbi:hypothetical protein [Streptomyces sp. NPDC002156]
MSCPATRINTHAEQFRHFHICTTFRTPCHQNWVESSIHGPPHRTFDEAWSYTGQPA